MRIVAGVLACVCMVVGSAYAQQERSAPDAQVTFYGGGSLWKTGLTGSKNAPFQGAIFQEDRLLVYFMWGHFLTLRFEPGVHTFSASLTERHAAENSQLSMTLAAGQHYFVRVVHQNSRDGFTSGKGLLEAVPCDVAQKEGGSTRPLAAKYLVDEALPRAVEGGDAAGMSVR